MFFFFFNFNDYKKVDERIEANGGKEAVDVLKKRMDSLGIKNADVAAMLDENKSGASRYFNRNMNITAERTQRTARALGGILRIENQDSDNERLVFSTESESFADLIMRFQNAADQDERDYLVACELPVASLNELGIDSRDYIIKSNARKTRKGLFEVSGGKVYWLTFINRFYKDIEFSILISPDMEHVIFRVGITYKTEDVSFTEIKEYKQAIEVDEGDEFLFKEYAESSMGRWMPAEYQAKTIYGDAISLEADRETLYSSFQVAFDKYTRLLAELTGTAPARNTNEKGVDLDVTVMPTEIIEAVMQDRKIACEVCPEHELFEGADGKPYVEIIPFVPINGRMIPQYGQKLITKANAVMLCPMCRAKLEHGSQGIREDIILKLYDKRIEEMKAAGLDISRTEILFSRFLENDYKRNPSLQRLLSYVKVIANNIQEG